MSVKTISGWLKLYIDGIDIRQSISVFDVKTDSFDTRWLPTRRNIKEDSQGFHRKGIFHWQIIEVGVDETRWTVVGERNTGRTKKPKRNDHARNCPRFFKLERNLATLKTSFRARASFDWIPRHWLFSISRRFSRMSAMCTLNFFPRDWKKFLAYILATLKVSSLSVTRTFLMSYLP